jgi:CRISPR system Cascade subunit CasE
MDAFVHATLAAGSGTPIDREEVYVQWLGRELGRGNASRLESARLTEFRREGMRRGDGGPIERPNAVLEGRLAVQDPSGFDTLLRRGLGRHRAFGFGMLLLRPAGG